MKSLGLLSDAVWMSKTAEILSLFFLSRSTNKWLDAIYLATKTICAIVVTRKYECVFFSRSLVKTILFSDCVAYAY